MDKGFKKFIDRLYIIKPALATVEKKFLRLVLPYLDLFFTTEDQNKKCYKRQFKLL